MKLPENDLKEIVNGIGLGNLLQFSDKTILITGGMGFLGRWIIETLEYANWQIFKEPCKIVVIDNYITGVRELYDDVNIKIFEHDVTKPTTILDDIHFIIHAAGIASPKFYTANKIKTLEVGTLGTRNMLELASEKNVESFVFFSSSEIYGDPSIVPTPELYNGNVSCTGPRSQYDESKRLGESLCVNYFQERNVPAKIIRFFNVYGPGMRMDDGRVIPEFVSKCLNKQAMVVNGVDTKTRSFCYITDAIIGVFKVLLSSYNGEAFNIGNDQTEITIFDLAVKIGNKTENPIIETLEKPEAVYDSADPKRRCPDLTKSKKDLNFVPKIDLDEGLKRFIEYNGK